MKIGFFDSGVGGLNVLYEGFLNLPKDSEFVYFADHDNVPYGPKSANEVKNLLSSALEFLKEQNCDAIVIACNTASSVADMDFRHSFSLPIVAMEPAIKPALERFKGENILVCATAGTIKGEKLQALLNSLKANDDCDLLALPQLVEFAQNSDFKGAQEFINTLALQKYMIVVLGCTHFNYFKREMKIANPALSFIDGNFGTIRHLANKLDLELGKNSGDLNELFNKTEFFISGKKANNDEIEMFKSFLARAKMNRAIK